MENIKRITLEGLPNTRDLGGFPTKDGKSIIPCRLIRSGTLYAMTEPDQLCLTQDYHLKSIIDFRTQDEYDEKPDPSISGVASHHVPVIEHVAVGVTHEENTDMNAFEHMISLLMAQGIDGDIYMQGVYQEIVAGAHANNAYRTFFDLLLAQTEGATLWHCSAGKDRVGMATALLLYALGVDTDLIVQDYMMTNEFVKEELDQIFCELKEKGMTSDVLRCTHACMTVKESYIQAVFDYIEETYGTIDQYLEQRLGLTPEKQAQLQALYLQ